MQSATAAERSTIRQLLSQDFEFESLGEATRFVGELAQVAAEDQNLEVELRGERVTVRIAGAGRSLSSRETAFMERIRGLA